MLKTKHLVILAVAVAVLAGIALLQDVRHEERTGRSASTVLLAGELTRDDAARIALGRGDEPEAVVIERTPAGWRLATAWDAAASGQRIDALLKALSDLTGEFRSDDPAVLADYGLADTTAVTIRVWDADGGQLAALDVGRSPAGARGQFVRKPDADAVYVSGTGLLAPLGLYGGPDRPTGRHFLDLQAVQEDKTEVDRIVLADGAGERVLAKVYAEVPAPADSAAAAGAEPGLDRLTWEWKLAGTDDGPLAKTKADAVLNAATSVRAVDVDDPGADPAAYGLDEPARTATLVFADGRELALRFGDARAAADGAPAGVWMTAGDDPTVWVVTSYTADNIFRTTEEQPDS